MKAEKKAFEPAERGALARLKAPTPAGWHQPRPEGFEFEVEEYCPALEPGDEGYGDEGYIQGPFYYGNAQGGMNNVEVPADLVEVVMSAGQMAARKLPTAEQIRQFLAWRLCDDGDDFEIHQTDRSGDEVECYGRTREGLGFGFTVKPTGLWRTDD